MQVNDSQGHAKSCFLVQTQKNVIFIGGREKKTPYNNFVIMLSLGAMRELKKPRPLIKSPIISVSSSITVLW